MCFYICILLIYIFNIKTGLKPPHSQAGKKFQICNTFEEDGLDYCEIILFDPFL